MTMTLKEASAYSGLTVYALRYNIGKGYIAIKRRGKRIILVEQSELDRFMRGE